LKVFLISKKKIGLIINIFLAFFVVFMLTLSTTYTAVMANKQHDPITSVETDEKKVAITFNIDEKSDINTAIENLGENDATFFLSSGFVELHPDKVKILSDKGYGIGILESDMKNKNKNQINDTVAGDLEEQTCVTMKSTELIRFNLNEYDNNSVKAIFTLDLYPIQWSCDDKVEAYSNGDIILVTDYEHIGAFIQKLKSNGFSLTPVDKLILKDNYKIDLSGRQSKKTGQP
jgi:hypothetical protein